MEATSPSSRRRNLVLCLTSLLAFAATSAWLHRWNPLPESYYVRSKLRYFAEHRDDYDAILVGSSNLVRSFIPALLDEELRSHGHDWKTFNMAIPAMSHFEADFYLDKILELKPARLKWVLLELSAFQPELNDNEFTQRTARWHEWPQTLAVSRVALGEDQPWLERWSLVGRHLALAAANLANLGQGPAMIDSLWQLREPDELAEHWASQQGFVTLGNPQGISPRLRPHLKQFEQRRNSLAEKNRGQSRYRDQQLECVRSQMEAIQAAGARTIHVLGPGLNGRPKQYNALVDGHVPTLIGLNQPDLYPRLYQPVHRFDPTHLNLRGAVLATKILANELSRLLSEETD